MFLTGTLAVFDEPISHWMTPERHAEEEAAAAEAKPVTAERAQRLAWGVAYMAEHHLKAAMWELWPSDAEGDGALSVFWFNEKQLYEAARLDPSTGRLLAESPTTPVHGTQAGHHFVDFHCELHAGAVGLWIVGIAVSWPLE